MTSSASSDAHPLETAIAGWWPRRSRGLVRLAGRLRSDALPERQVAEPERPDASVPGAGRRAVPTRDTTPRHALDGAFSLAPIADGRQVFVGLLSPEGVVLDGFPRRTVEHEDPHDGSRLWETPWWAWSPDVQERLRSAVARAGTGELVRYDDTVRLAGNMLVTVDLTVAPVVTTSGITAVRCSVTDPGDAGPRREPGRHRSRVRAAAAHVDDDGRQPR